MMSHTESNSNEDVTPHLPEHQNWSLIIQWNLVSYQRHLLNKGSNQNFVCTELKIVL